MTAAEMRKIMEGVVLFGTGKNAQLNGYSSAGKTGTASMPEKAKLRMRANASFITVISKSSGITF